MMGGDCGWVKDVELTHFRKGHAKSNSPVQFVSWLVMDDTRSWTVMNHVICRHLSWANRRMKCDWSLGSQLCIKAILLISNQAHGSLAQLILTGGNRWICWFLSFWWKAQDVSEENLILRNQLSLPGSAAICRKKIASSSQGDGICGEDLEIREMIWTWEQNYDLMSNQTRQWGLGKGWITVRF